MTGSGGSSAKVTVSSYISISDQIMLTLSFNSYTSRYAEALYETSDISSISDEIIIAYLKTRTTYSTSEDLSPYADLSPGTSYTYCAVGIDASGNYGTTLTRYNITTKSTSSQPRATISITSTSSSSIGFSVTKNSYCSSYKLWGGGFDYSNMPDIFYAYIAVNNGASYSSNGSGTLPIDMSYTYSIIIALAYNSSGVNSGFLDMKVVNNSNRAIVRSAQVDLRSISEDDMRKLISGKMDGEFINAILNFSGNE
jgi:hypothetical protein